VATIPWKRLVLAGLVPSVALYLDFALLFLLGALVPDLNHVDGPATRVLVVVVVVAAAITTIAAAILAGVITGRALQRRPFIAGVGVGIAGWTFTIISTLLINIPVALATHGGGGGQGLGVIVGLFWIAGVLCSPITGLASRIASRSRFQRGAPN